MRTYYFMVTRYYIRKKRKLTKPILKPQMIILLLKWFYQDDIQFQYLQCKRKENGTIKTIIQERSIPILFQTPASTIWNQQTDEQSNTTSITSLIIYMNKWTITDGVQESFKRSWISVLIQRWISQKEKMIWWKSMESINWSSILSYGVPKSSVRINIQTGYSSS